MDERELAKLGEIEWKALEHARREAEEQRALAEIEAELVREGYSPERAAELAVWELHVRNGGD